MRSHYYDLTTLEQDAPAAPLPPVPPREAPVPPPPLYEELAPDPRRPARRKGNGGTAIFCTAIVLLAAGLIALVVMSGLHPTLELPELPSTAPSYGFSLPSLSDTVSETTIERYRGDSALTLALEDAPEGGQLAYQQVYEKVIPSIVGVRAYGTLTSAQGTGVILSADGYVITNFHVIEGADRAQVVLQDGAVHDALLAGGDRTNDLAVLKIEAQGLTPAAFGDSDLLRVGDEAFAIGNPLGEQFMGTMTNGIVSAINRNVNADGITMTLIQTTAALNSGNSGGALVNLWGQVVGITNMKMMSNYNTIEGLGFAIPAVTVKTVADQLIAQGHVAGRPVLGITVQPIPQADWADYDLPEDFDGGLLVSRVQAGSGAEGKVEVGDFIVEANGTAIRANADLLNVRTALTVGDTITLKLWRSGAYHTVTVTLVDQYTLDGVKE